MSDNNTTEQAIDAIIIGAGLTGLSTAYFLKKRGKRVLIVEKTNRIGGSIHTHQENGYIVESGPNTGSLSSPEIAELLEDLKGCRLETAHKDAHKRLILKNGKFTALPAGHLSAVFTPLFSWKDKFNICLEPWRKKGNNPNESIAGLTLRRLGKSFLNYAVDPFISGIYAGDPSLLITRHALPKLYNLEQTYGSFMRGAIQKARLPKTDREKKANKEVFSVEGGLENLIDSLTKYIGESNIQTDTDNLLISGSANHWTVSQGEKSWTAPVLISTVGAHALPRLFPFIPASLMNQVNNLRYARIVQVAVGLPLLSGVDFKAFGGLIPSIENRNLLGVLYPSSCFKKRSPEGKALLSVFLGGIRRPEIVDWTDQQIEETLLKELSAIYQVTALRPDYLRVFRHTQAIPQYEINTDERLRAIAVVERDYPGIILAGNLRDGIGMADRVRQAEQISHLV